MKPSRRTLSVRARLTLWNIGVLTMVLVVLGFTLRYVANDILFSNVDAQLQARAGRVARQWRSTTGRGPRRPDPASAAQASRLRDTVPDPAFSRLINRAGNSLRSFGGSSTEIVDRTAFTMALAGQDGYSTVRVGDDKLRVYSAPLRDTRGQIQGVVQVPFRLNTIESGLHRLDRTLLTLIPLALVLAGGGGAFLTVRALQPVRQLMDATDRIEAENLSGRLPVQGRDEFAELARRFNTMLGRLDASFQRLSRFTADASHELRTPLAIIKANTSLALEQSPPPEQYRKTLETIDAAVDRSNRIVQDLLFLARNDSGRPSNNHDFQPLPVAALLSDIESLSLAEEPDSPRLIVEEPAPDLLVCGDAHQLSRVFGNLVENALRHTPPTGQVVVRAEAIGAQVQITVADTGEGISTEHLPHIFERFYRVDADRGRRRGGTGLGLAIVQSIVHAHHGTIRLESRLGQGTLATVLLPQPSP